MTNEHQKKKPWENVTPVGRMLRPSVVFERTGLSKSQTYWMIEQGDFPPFIKLGSRASALPEEWLNAFISDRAKKALGQTE